MIETIYTLAALDPFQDASDAESVNGSDTADTGYQVNDAHSSNLPTDTGPQESTNDSLPSAQNTAERQRKVTFFAIYDIIM